MPACGNFGRRSMLAGLGGVGLAALARPARGGDAAVVTLSSTSFANASLFLADKLGLFAAHGTPLKLVVVDSGSLAVSAVLSGSAQYTASGVSDALIATARGQQLKLVANAYHGLSGSVVIAKARAAALGLAAGSSVAARRKALGDLSVAIPSATSSYVPPVVGAAAEGGGKPRLIYMAQPTMVTALQAGAVQGIMCGSPFWEPAVTGGFGQILLNGPAGEFPADSAPVSTTALITTAAYAAANPAQVGGIQAALAELGAMIGSDPARVQAALEALYPKLDPDTVALSFRQNSASWTHPSFDVQDVQHELAIMLKNRPVPGLRDVRPQGLLLGGV